VASEPVPIATDQAPPPRRRLLSTLGKVAVTVALYAILFAYKLDLHKFLDSLRAANLAWVALGIIVYAGGQWLSAWRWWLLLRPVELQVRYLRMVAFYFIGMFFNFFLPTIVGGDAVKAILLSRETGAPARSTMSVFMERNVGLLALLTIATAAAGFAPTVEVKGISLLHLALLLFAGFIAANLVLADRRAYHLIDYLVALTPLGRLRSRASSLYDAVVPYRARRWRGVVAAAIVQSFLFQAIVILVVFLNAKALALDVPVAALAVFVPLISLAGMLPSMNGLGIRDVLYVLLLGRIGVPADVAFALAFLYFVVTFAASLPGGVVYALRRGPGIRSERTT